MPLLSLAFLGILVDAALAAGVPVEMHACEGAGHGKVIDTCPEAYRPG